MLENNKIADQKRAAEYPYVKEFLDRVLRRERIDMVLLGRFQPNNPELYRLVSEWKYDPALSNKPLREERETQKILGATREKVDRDPSMQKIEGYLTKNISKAAEGKNISEISELIEDNIGLELIDTYGDYTDFVIKTSALSIYHKLKRKCGVNTVSHWNGVGFMVYKLSAEMDKIFKQPSQLYAAIAYGHDVIEELLSKEIDGKNYGLENLDKFLEEIIVHDSMKQPIMVVTNFNNTNVNDLYAKITGDKKFFESEEILRRLDGSNQHHKVIKQVLKEYEGKAGRELKEALKWYGYKKYSKGIGDWCNKEKQYIPFIAKTCDGFDNYMGNSALSEMDRIKNLNKINYFSSIIYDMKLPKEHILNSLDDELLQYALESATYMVLDYFLQPKAQVRHFESAFNMIKEMKPIFYTHEEKN
jgi:hypothetical protein